MGFFSDLKESVGDVFEAPYKAVSAVVEGAGDVIAGRSLDDSKEKLGNSVNLGMNSFLKGATGGQGALIDAKTGGNYSKAVSANNTLGNLIAGKSVQQNIKDSASLALQAGQKYIGDVGVNAGGQDLTGFFQNLLGGINNKISGVSNSGENSQGVSPNPVNFYEPSQASYNGNVAQSNTMPIILIGGLVIVGAYFLFKRR